MGNYRESAEKKFAGRDFLFVKFLLFLLLLQALDYTAVAEKQYQGCASPMKFVLVVSANAMTILSSRTRNV